MMTGDEPDTAGAADVRGAHLQDATVRPISAEQLGDLFRRSGIRRPTADLDRLGRMLAHANLTIGAWSADRLVGVARGWTDFSYCCYLSDLAVDRTWHRRGIGRGLVADVCRRVGPEVSIILVAAPEASGYYGPLGFEPVTGAWRLPRTR